MNLIRRIELILFSFLLLLTLVSITAYRLVVHDSFVAMEAVQEKRDIARMKAVVAQDADTLQALVEDWSFWDDAYEFMADNNSAFIQSNLIDATFETYRIDLVLFLNNSNGIHYQRARGWRAAFPPIPLVPTLIIWDSDRISAASRRPEIRQSRPMSLACCSRRAAVLGVSPICTMARLLSPHSPTTTSPR